MPFLQSPWLSGVDHVTRIGRFDNAIWQFFGPYLLWYHWHNSANRMGLDSGQHLNEICTCLKFIYSEKTTKFCEIFPLLLTFVFKSKEKISQNFVAFSEYMNFKIKAFQLFLNSYYTHMDNEGYLYFLWRSSTDNSGYFYRKYALNFSDLYIKDWYDWIAAF